MDLIESERLFVVIEFTSASVEVSVESHSMHAAWQDGVATP
jgi:hypothetical protein